MASFLSSLISRDPRAAFAYDLPATSIATIDGVQIGNSFKKADADEAATVFWASPDCANLRLQTQKLKTMRHPNILTYLDSIEVENTLYLVTERCQPLQCYLRDAQLSGEQMENVVAWGLYQVMCCLKFLHEAKISHENLRRAIFVTQAGDWKIAVLHKSTAFTTPRSDLNQLGLVLWEAFNGFNDGLSTAQPPGKIPKKLHELYKRMATPAAAKYSVAELVREVRGTGGFCKSRYVDTLLFLEEFQLKDAPEKGAFFNQLRENVGSFPDDVAKYKILPRLIHTYEYGDAGPNILIPMFKLGRLLSEEEYQRRIVPCLVKLFSSPDRTTRVKLLEKIDEFAPQLTPAVVNEKIYGNLAQGFLDTSPAVRESTVKAMVVLADKLNTHNLNNDLMKYLAKLQGTDEHGGIRTNTTICLGKIAAHLEPSGRQRILLGAFTRGLKDPFPPARMAAVLALSATQQFYALVEVANRILPSIAPLTCDPEKNIRDQAFAAIKGFLEKLEKASNDPSCIAELEASVKAGGKSLLDSDKVPQWASWALKSLSGKFVKAAPMTATPTEGTTRAGSPAAQDKPSPNSGFSASSTATSQKKTLGTGLNKPTVEKSGWDDDDDGEVWKDAEEAATDEEDWTDGWQNTNASKKSSIAAKSTIAKPAAGKLQFGATKKQDENDGGLADKFAASSISSKTSAASSGWDQFDEDSTFEVSAAAAPAVAKNTSGGGGGGGSVSASNDGWDEGDGWGDTQHTITAATQSTSKPLSVMTSSTAADKEARKAEIAAKNEARRKELAAKRAAKSGGGALKLNAVKKNDVPPELDGDWGSSGW